MTIEYQQTDSGGRYTTTVEGHTGYISYLRSGPNLITVDHTKVPDELRGRGIGQALAKHIVEEARKSGWKIVPLCPFFKAQSERHPDWEDVIA